MTNIDFSFFLFLSFFLLSPKFKTAAGFCRLGSYTGHNTRPSSYSPSCPSLTKQSPSVTSSSDRRRPLGLCQDWVMCECWTGIREKNNTLHTEGQRSEGLKLPLFLFVLDFLWERTCRDCARDEEKGKKRTERKGVVVSTQVKHREKKWLEQEEIKSKANKWTKMKLEDKLSIWAKKNKQHQNNKQTFIQK